LSPGYVIYNYTKFWLKWLLDFQKQDVLTMVS
jgi:hypothetical protein